MDSLEVATDETAEWCATFGALLAPEIAERVTRDILIAWLEAEVGPDGDAAGEGCYSFLRFKIQELKDITS